MSKIKAYLIFSENEIFPCESCGAQGTAFGEISCNSSVFGYRNVITDAASEGYITMLTNPMTGNVGIKAEDMDIPIRSAALITHDICSAPSNYRCGYTLSEYLCRHCVPAVAGIDTRALARRIARFGRIRAAVTTEDITKKDKLTEIISLFNNAKPVVLSETESSVSSGNGNRHIVIYNLGGAAREAEAMTTRNMRVTVVPRTYSAQMICALNPYGIIISDGSEAAGISDSLKNNIKEIIELKINTIAVGFGHIICAAALGAETEELNSGHRGQNYSVLCPVKSRIYVTDQNHGYTVKNNSIPRLVGEITQINLSDLTPEAIRYRGYPLETVQYRPDNTSNEHTTGWIYDEFTAKCKGDI